MRCAERGPRPGSTRSASISRSRPLADGTPARVKTAGSKRQLEPGRQAEPRGHATHLLGARRLDLARAVVERSGDEVLEHLAIVPNARRIDTEALHWLLAAHLHIDPPSAGLP